MKSLIIIRGLPGSGKSSLAEILSEGKYPVHSIDDFFTDESGKYFFDHTKNHLAYKQCEARTRESMNSGAKKIFVDNVFSIDWEMEPYFKLASEFDYRIFVLTVEKYHNEKNIHRITEEQIEKMAAKYKVKLK